MRVKEGLLAQGLKRREGGSIHSDSRGSKIVNSIRPATTPNPSNWNTVTEYNQRIIDWCRLTWMPEIRRFAIWFLGHLDEFFDGAADPFENLMGLGTSVHISRCGDDFICSIHDKTLNGTIRVLGTGLF